MRATARPPRLIELLFGTYRRRILALLLLHPEQGFYTREVMRLTGVPAGSLHRELIALTAAGLLGSAGLLAPALTLLGFGSGLFTVGGVALMMDMTSATQTGLFVGVWTLVQAVAKGPAAIVGGALQSGLAGLGLSAGQAYAAVFALEGVGVLLSILLLTRVGVTAFRLQVSGGEALQQAAALD